MLSDGEHNLTEAAAESSAAAPPPDSLRSPLPRRAVPTTFNPIINDEANILAAITRGDRTLCDLAEEHGTTVANFALWLQREDIQQKLNDLTSAGTTLTRVAAVNQLPKAVKAMAFQIEARIFDRTHNLIKPGLATDKIAALRDANARKACNLLLRLARFDPSLPLYRAPKLLPRPERASASVAPPPEGEVRPKAGEGAPVFSTCSTRSLIATSDIPHPTSDIDLFSLCAAALTAAHNARESRVSSTPEPERGGPDPGTRLPSPAFFSVHSALRSPHSAFPSQRPPPQRQWEQQAHLLHLATPPLPPGRAPAPRRTEPALIRGSSSDLALWQFAM